VQHISNLTHEPGITGRSTMSAFRKESRRIDVSRSPRRIALTHPAFRRSLPPLHPNRSERPRCATRRRKASPTAASSTNAARSTLEHCPGNDRPTPGRRTPCGRPRQTRDPNSPSTDSITDLTCARRKLCCVVRPARVHGYGCRLPTTAAPISLVPDASEQHPCCFRSCRRRRNPYTARILSYFV